MSSSVPGTQGRWGNENECVVASMWILLKVLALFIPPEKSDSIFTTVVLIWNLKTRIQDHSGSKLLTAWKSDT